MRAASLDPTRGLRAVAAATLTLEAVVVLLAVPAVHGVGGGGVAAYVALGALIAALLLAAGTQRLRWGTWLGSAAQLGVFLSGLLSWPLFVLGLAFGGIWVGYLVLRSGAQVG